MSYTKIITYGTFDMFHIGHLNLLQRLKQMGDELIVAISTDEFNDIKIVLKKKEKDKRNYKRFCCKEKL